MHPRHLYFLLLFVVTGNAATFDPVCSRNFETLRLTAEIIDGQTEFEHWHQAHDALLDIQSDVIQLLASAHGEWLNAARWEAAKNLREKIIPIQRVLLRERVILSRYALDIANNEQDRQQARIALHIAQKKYCTTFPEATSYLPLKPIQ